MRIFGTFLSWKKNAVVGHAKTIAELVRTDALISKGSMGAQCFRAAHTLAQKPKIR